MVSVCSDEICQQETPLQTTAGRVDRSDAALISDTATVPINPKLVLVV